jgi:pyruvate kinase
VPFSTSAITEKDYADISFCVEQRVDFIALSFVRMAQEVRHLKQFVESRGTRLISFLKSKSSMR